MCSNSFSTMHSYSSSITRVYSGSYYAYIYIIIMYYYTSVGVLASTTISTYA